MENKIEIDTPPRLSGVKPSKRVIFLSCFLALFSFLIYVTTFLNNISTNEALWKAIALVMNKSYIEKYQTLALVMNESGVMEKYANLSREE